MNIALSTYNKIKEALALIHEAEYDIAELSEKNDNLSTYQTDVDNTIAPLLVKYEKILNELVVNDRLIPMDTEGEGDGRI